MGLHHGLPLHFGLFQPLLFLLGLLGLLFILFEIVFLSLKPDNGLPKLLGFALELVRVHGLHVQRLDSDGKGDFLLLLQLFLGLGHLAASVLDIGNTTTRGFGATALASGLLLFLLGLHHGLPLHFGLLQPLLFLLGLLGLLFILFLAEPLLLFLLLLSQFLLLLGPDLLALGLLLLEPLQFLFLLGTLFTPFVDVFAQLFVQFALLFWLAKSQFPFWR